MPRYNLRYNSKHQINWPNIIWNALMPHTLSKKDLLLNIAQTAFLAKELETFHTQPKYFQNTLYSSFTMGKFAINQKVGYLIISIKQKTANVISILG